MGRRHSITAPDTAGSVGEYTSLALDASGNPVVSYFAAFPNSELRVLHCAEPTCTVGNTITAPDPAPAVGRYTSLALDASGNPVVSYSALLVEDLKVLHCGDTTCSGAKPATATPLPPVGGIALDPELDALPLDTVDSSGPGTRVLVGIAAGAAVGVLGITISQISATAEILGLSPWFFSLSSALIGGSWGGFIGSLVGLVAGRTHSDTR